MDFRTRILAAAALALCAACGSGKTYNLSGTATVNGTVGGKPLAAADAVSTVVTQGASSAGAIFITTAANQCNLVNAHQDLKNGTGLAFALGTRTGTTLAVPAVGTYNVFTTSAGASQQGKVAAAQFSTTDATCRPTTTEATSGVVVLTSVDDTGYGGTFDLTFGTTDHLTGSFASGTCSALATNQVTCPP